MMREEGCLSLRAGETAIVLGPAPVTDDKDERSPEERILGERREHYANLLNRPVSDKELEMLP